MIYTEDEEYDRKVDMIIKDAKEIGAAVYIARSERDFRINQYDRLAYAALDLCLIAHKAFGPRTAPNTKLTRPASEPVPATGADGLGSSDLLDS